MASKQTAGSVATESELQDQAWEAIAKFLNGPLAFIVEGPARGVDISGASNGTGTLLKTTSGKIVLLTAKHVLQDLPDGGFSIGGPPLPGDAIDNAIERYWGHPDADVAVASLRSGAAAALAAAAIPSGCVAESQDWIVQATDPPVICGYPSRYRVREIDHLRRRVSQGFVNVTYNTSVERELDHRGRYRVDWNEAVAEEPDARLAPLRIPRGEVFDLTHPGGISGGPLWRVGGKVPKGEVWVPEKKAKIIGVAEAYIKADRIQVCPSVKVWGDWFHNLIREIDG